MGDYLESITSVYMLGGHREDGVRSSLVSTSEWEGVQKEADGL